MPTLYSRSNKFTIGTNQTTRYSRSNNLTITTNSTNLYSRSNNFDINSSDPWVPGYIQNFNLNTGTPVSYLLNTEFYKFFGTPVDLTLQSNFLNNYILETFPIQSHFLNNYSIEAFTIQTDFLSNYILESFTLQSDFLSNYILETFNFQTEFLNNYSLETFLLESNFLSNYSLETFNIQTNFLSNYILSNYSITSNFQTIFTSSFVIQSEFLKNYNTNSITAAFRANTYYFSPSEKIYLYDLSISTLPIVSWQWSITGTNGFTFSSTVKNPVVDISTINQYEQLTITLTVSNGQSTDSITATNLIIVDPAYNNPNFSYFGIGGDFYGLYLNNKKKSSTTITQNFIVSRQTCGINFDFLYNFQHISNNYNIVKQTDYIPQEKRTNTVSNKIEGYFKIKDSILYNSGKDYLEFFPQSALNLGWFNLVHRNLDCIKEVYYSIYLYDYDTNTYYDADEFFDKILMYRKADSRNRRLTIKDSLYNDQTYDDTDFGNNNSFVGSEYIIDKSGGEINLKKYANGLFNYYINLKFVPRKDAFVDFFGTDKDKIGFALNGAYFKIRKMERSAKFLGTTGGKNNLNNSFIFDGLLKFEIPLIYQHSGNLHLEFLYLDSNGDIVLKDSTYLNCLNPRNPYNACERFKEYPGYKAGYYYFNYTDSNIPESLPGLENPPWNDSFFDTLLNPTYDSGFYIEYNKKGYLYYKPNEYIESLIGTNKPIIKSVELYINIGEIKR